MISVSFNFITTLIIFFVALLPIFTLFINKSINSKNKNENKIKIQLSISTVELLLTIIIVIFIISNVFDLIQNRISLYTLIILATIISVLIIIFFTNISYNIKIRMYLLVFFIIILTYVLVTSIINSLQPYSNDSIRDIIVVNSIITNNKLDFAQIILKETEPYYSVIPLFQLLLTILTFITSNINYSYIFVGTIQLIGIIFGMSLISFVFNNNNKYIKEMKLIINSLLIVGLPYGFFTIIQPQSSALIFLPLIIYIFIKIIKNKENDTKYYLLLFIIFIFFANIYHAIVTVIFIIFIFIYFITNYTNIKNILKSKFLLIIILVFLLTIIYWYDMSAMSRIYREVNRFKEALFTFNINNLPQSSEEYFTKGFKPYAYSFAFLLAINLALLIVWSFYKFQINKVNIKEIIGSLNIGLALVVIIIATLAFISVVANPIYSGLNRYLVGQGGIFLLSSVTASSIIIILINSNKRIFIITILMLFIYNLSGLTQPYWIPDFTFPSYSTYTNYENIHKIYENINNDDIFYLYSNIPIIHKMTDYDELKLYKLKADYTGLSRKFLNNEPLFYNISSPSQSVINIHINEKINDITISSNKFNVIFMSNRYAGFYTMPSMIK